MGNENLPGPSSPIGGRSVELYPQARVFFFFPASVEMILWRFPALLHPLVFFFLPEPPKRTRKGLK